MNPAGRLVTAVLAAAILTWPTSSMAEDDHEHIGVQPGSGGFLGEGTGYASETAPQPAPTWQETVGHGDRTTEVGQPPAEANPMCDGVPSLSAPFLGPLGDLCESASGDSASVTPQPLTTAAITRAFREIPVLPAPLHIQPPDGKTLVNFRTNFFTEDQSFNRTITLLGRRVELRIEVASYTWHFGDGETLTTDDPGAPYPRLRITHNYRAKGRCAPSLDTTYVADFRVGGGPWREVPGSVTIEGQPVSLRAIEARPTLVGYDG